MNIVELFGDEPMLRRLVEDLVEIVSLTAFMALVAVVAHGLPG